MFSAARNAIEGLCVLGMMAYYLLTTEPAERWPYVDEEDDDE